MEGAIAMFLVGHVEIPHAFQDAAKDLEIQGG